MIAKSAAETPFAKTINPSYLGRSTASNAEAEDIVEKRTDHAVAEGAATLVPFIPPASAADGAHESLLVRRVLRIVAAL